MVQFSFDATKYAPNQGGGGTVPTGDYDVAITSTDTKSTRNNDGQMLVVTMTIQTGEHKGKRLIDRLNLSNPNQQTVEIAFSTLSAICHVVGRMTFQNTTELHGIPFKVSVVEEPRNDKPDKMTNNIVAYMDAQGKPPGAAGSAPAQAPSAAPTQAPAATPQPAAPATAPAQAPVQDVVGAPATAPAAAAPELSAPAQPAATAAPATTVAQPAPPAQEAPAAPAGSASGKPPWEE